MLTYPDINPVAFSLGSLEIRWYGIAYVLGILGAWQCCAQLAKRGYSSIKDEHLADFIPYATLGILIGGRLGHVILYDFAYYLHNPLEIVQIWKPGMAFHGGLLGVILVTIWYCRSRRIRILTLCDLISVGAPIGLFFGRLANFVNGELWGRLTDSPLGMVFPYAGPFPRHPSQLYEAVLEGVVLFVIQLSMIYTAKRKTWRSGVITGSFCLGYAVMRSLAEYFREPEDGFIGPFTAGQFWSLPLLIGGIILLYRGLRERQTHA